GRVRRRPRRPEPPSSAAGRGGPRPSSRPARRPSLLAEPTSGRAASSPRGPPRPPPACSSSGLLPSSARGNALRRGREKFLPKILEKVLATGDLSTHSCGGRKTGRYTTPLPEGDSGAGERPADLDHGHLGPG